MDLLAKPQFLGAAAGNAFIDNVIPFTGLLGAANTINAAGYDLILDLHSTLRSRLLCLLTKAPLKLRYHKASLARRLFVDFRIPSPSLEKHTLDRYLEPLERLAHLRRVMYASTMSLGQSQLALDHQGKPGEKFVENTRFLHGGVMFVAINMPGSNNNLVLNAKECTNKSARNAAQCDAANSEHLERDTANVAWLTASFAQAKVQNALGLVLVVQGDPGFDLPETEELDESMAPGVSGYRHFMAQLVRQTEQFKGQVLFVHGDTHYFKLDKPLYSPGKLLSNLTRLQTFGSPSLHWVRVTVDPAASQIFQIHPVILEQAKG